MPSFGTLGKLFKISNFSVQKSHIAGGRGGPRIYFVGEIVICLLLRNLHIDLIDIILLYLKTLETAAKL